MNPDLKSTCLCALILAAVISLTSSEIFTSSLKVERMVMEEESLLGEFKRFIDQQYERLKTFSNFYSDRLRDVRFRSGQEVRHELQHPNAVYNVIKRFANDYSSVLGENFESFRYAVRNSMEQFLADREDIRGAKRSLLRLQAVYKMKALDMARGDYLGFQGPPLAPVDVYEIGQTAFSEGKLNESIEWLNASITLYLGPEGQALPYGPSVAAIKALMARVHLFNGDVATAEGLYEYVKTLEPTHGDVIELERELKSHPTFVHQLPQDYFQNFSRLCSLENRHHVPDPNNPRLVCRYRETLLPYYRFKEEILSVAPFASVIYNVISDVESDHLKSFVKNKLIRGKVGGDHSIVSEIRTSDLAWIWDNESKMATSIAKRIECITGLDTSQRLPFGPSSGEAFQVVNYGLGGHYEVHMDPFDIPPTQPELKDSGERIATFLIYLSDVQRGGSTVFTRAGIAVAPVKNMALLWYNYDPAHQRDDMTHHAGCPVLFGQKWICNKWIWTYGNTLRRRCGLTPEATQLDIEPDIKRGYK
ncbi:prolyl 4-hydroxylase subunit alpha-3-like [Physella acuta]|uniref:prolyl 4-hydroxylase subunit alpha-3-like n=1 Tax=Physella acuta TaxID=109671 RepID=UPI0027DE4D6F|nr:prolyl 4-hydroxylase subunit alpha-3-like [Physella acuta]